MYSYIIHKNLIPILRGSKLSAVWKYFKVNVCYGMQLGHLYSIK